MNDRIRQYLKELEAAIEEADEYIKKTEALNQMMAVALERATNYFLTRDDLGENANAVVGAMLIAIDKNNKGIVEDDDE